MSRRKRNRPRPEPAEGPLRRRQVTIKSHRPELEPRVGVVYECPCGFGNFIMWQIDAHRDPHLQCVRCGAVFCCGDDCQHEEDEDRELRREMEGRPPPSNNG